MRKTNWFPLCFILSVGVVLNAVAAVNYYGNFIGGTFTGDGTGLTGVGLLNSPNTWSAANTWQGANTFNLGGTFASGAFAIDNSGNVTATSFSGDGHLLTALNASALSTGTVPAGRLLGIFFTNVANFISGNQTFLNNVYIGGLLLVTNGLAWTTNNNLEVTNVVVRNTFTNVGTSYFGSAQQASISSGGVYTGDLSGGTNITYQYEINQTGSTTLNWGQCIMTNIAADVTVALQSVTASPEAQKYRTIVYFVTNATASNFKVTSPSGVIGPVGSGTPSVLYCTNKTLTRFIFEHAGPNWITVSKSDFGA